MLLRSKTPAMVEQEFWAMLCVYQAIRELISYAAPTGPDPGRVGFKRAFEAARHSVTRAAPLPPAALTRALAHLTEQLIKAGQPDPRPARTDCPRTRERGDSHRYPRRKDDARPVRTVSYTIVLQPLKPTEPP